MFVISVMSKVTEDRLNACIFDILTILQVRDYTRQKLIDEVHNDGKHTVSCIVYAINYLKSFSYIDMFESIRRNGKVKLFITSKGREKLEKLKRR